MGYYKEKQNGRKTGKDAARDATTKRVPFDQLRFVDLTLTAEEKEEFRGLLADGRFDASPLDSWLEAGFAFKLSTKDGGKTVTGTLTCSDPEHVCGGGVLSAFGGDSATVIALLAYKDQVLSGELGWFEAQRSRRGTTTDIG